MNFLNHIGVKNKLRSLLASVLLVALAVIVFEAVQTRHYLLEGRKQEINYLVSNTISLVNYFYQRRDEIGEAQAKQQAFDAIRSLRYNNGKGYFWINDHDLKLLMHPVKPAKEGKDMTEVQDGDGQYHWQAMLKMAESKAGGGFVEYSYKGPQFDQPMAKISYVQDFPEWRWIIGTGIYVDDIEEQFLTIIGQSALMFLIVVAVVFVLAAVLTQSILNPLTAMVKNMKVAAKGDLQIIIEDQNRKDELGQLNRSFAMLLETFRDLIAHSKQGNDQISDVVAMSVDVSSQTVEGVDSQYAETDSLASAVEELSATLTEVSSNTAETNQLTEDVHKQVVRSNDQMNRTVDSVREVSSSVENASLVVQKLEEDIKQIDSILGVIRNISEQTNLLALNAAIEAARAGESGRGFAVVADEVRQLAQRTHESTEEIQNMTEGLQSEALKAVSVMNTSVDQAKQGEELAVTTGQDLQQVTQNVNAVTERIGHVANTVEQQSQVIMEVNHNVVSIRDIANQTREGSKVMSQQFDSLHGLVNSTRKLLSQYQV